MTHIRDLLGQGPTLSFEFFPPKTDQGLERLREAVNDLAKREPSFVSVTYGAGGSTREKTEGIVKEINRNTGVTPMPHLTCIAHAREELEAIVHRYREEGLENILSLHGDPPRDNPDIEPGDLTRAARLVELIREVGDFSVGVAAHVEGHPNAPDPETDRRHQAEKLKVADFGITQFFFRAEDYFRFIEEMEAHGVETPVIAGVIPVTDAKQTQRFAEMAGAEFPRDLAERFDAVADDPEEVRRIGVEVATDVCQRVLDAGAPGLHLYALNRSQAVGEVCDNLGFGAWAPRGDW
jgi:methylenetetrahydrofolate reductase (NADPH)